MVNRLLKLLEMDVYTSEPSAKTCAEQLPQHGPGHFAVQKMVGLGSTSLSTKHNKR